MRSGLVLAIGVALFAVSCAGADRGAVIERRASGETPPVDAPDICNDVEAFALGSHAGEPLDAIVDELARLAALLGANDVLAPLSDMRAAATANEPMADAMHAAAEALDRQSFETCGIPAFTAMCVTASFASCFSRAPIAAGTMVPESSTCDPATAPPFLPCFDQAAGYIPVDCRDGSPVVVRNWTWLPAT